jgi:hypothetical protein
MAGSLSTCPSVVQMSSSIAAEAPLHATVEACLRRSWIDLALDTNVR